MAKTKKTTKTKSYIDRERTAEANASFFKFCEECIKVEDEDGNLTPLVLRNIQTKLISAVLFGNEFLIRRWMHHKPRQVGLTTVHWALSMWLAISRPHHKALIMANEEDLAEDILGRVRAAYELLPDWYDKPELAKDRSAALSFKDHGGAMFIGTAGTKKKGASAKLGRTYQSIYATELADAAWDPTIIKRVFQCAHELAIVMLDSTANGAQGWWYNEWMSSKRGQSNFVPFFATWFDHERYRRDAGENFVRTPEEVELAEQYSLTNDQLAWRRWKLNEITEEEFNELYPVNDIESFLTSGSPCFSPRDIQFMRTSTEFANGWPTLRGNLQPVCSR